MRIDEWEVHGSMVGWMEMKTAEYLRGGQLKDFAAMKDCTVIEENGKTYLGKVESITLHEKDADNEYIAIAITDNDMGGSELLMMEIKI